MLKKEFCANYSVAAVKSFRVQAEEDLEERLIYCCAAILLLLSLNYCSMSKKLLLGAFSLLEKDHLLIKTIHKFNLHFYFISSNIILMS
jgi:hypothetical protein